MADKTGIEWTDATWNPVAGCSIISPGCTNCYAMKMGARLAAMGVPLYAGLTQPSKAGPVWTGIMRLAGEKQLTQPMRWKKPRRIFVNSMSDLFHKDVRNEWIDKVFAVAALASQHTLQILTKRSDGMRDWFLGRSGPAHLVDMSRAFAPATMPMTAHEISVRLCPGISPQARALYHAPEPVWPLPNVWLGVSVENRAALYRIDDLRATPAAKRFLSIEPLLEDLGEIDLAGIDWVIAGGESGPAARPMHPDWVRNVRDQCAVAGVPFFFKQWGEWLPDYEEATNRPDDHPEQSRFKTCVWDSDEGAWDETNGHWADGDHWYIADSYYEPEQPMTRVGKHAAGAMLDGIEHKVFPA